MSIRLAYHCGSWYTNNTAQLSNELNGYLSKAEKDSKSDNLKSIIVPHAGYTWCADTAAKAFININPEKFNRAVILGPSHHEYFEGCGLSKFSNFQTPFGNVKIDVDTNNMLLKEAPETFFTLSESVDLNEHSIEQEMPFLKYIFKDKNFSILPIMVGDSNLRNNRNIGKLLYNLYEDEKTLFVISSDFCHWGRRFGYTYFDKSYETPSESIEALDKAALEIIGRMNSEQFDDYFKKTRNTICGRNPISSVLTIIENYQKNNNKKKVSFECAGYSQSERVKSFNGSSVSYAAGVNFIF